MIVEFRIWRFKCIIMVPLWLINLMLYTIYASLVEQCLLDNYFGSSKH